MSCKHFWIDSKYHERYVCTKCGLETNDYEQYYPYKNIEDTSMKTPREIIETIPLDKANLDYIGNK